MQLSVVLYTLHRPRPLLGVSCYNCRKILDQLDPPFRGIIHDLHTGYKIVQLAKIRTRNPHVTWPKSQPMLTFRAANRVCNSGPIRLFDVVSVVMCMNRGFPSLKLSDFVVACNAAAIFSFALSVILKCLLKRENGTASCVG